MIYTKWNRNRYRDNWENRNRNRLLN